MPMGRAMFVRPLFLLTPFLAACSMVVEDAPVIDAPRATYPAVPDTPFAQGCDPWDEWDKPARPFQIMGNSWYVGTCGISAVLVTGENGHILIDSGVERTGRSALASVKALGFEPSDIRLLLMSHEHDDHIGAHGFIEGATRARIVASTRAANVIESGELSTDDPQAASGHERMTPATVSRIVGDGEVVKLGKLEITAHETPGHTPGALSWTWWSCSLPGEPPVCRRMAYVDSLSAVSSDEYRFSDHPEYVAAFRNSIDKVRSLPCDYLVTPHPSASQMIKKMREGTFDKPGACQRYADSLTKNLDARLAKEAAE